MGSFEEELKALIPPDFAERRQAAIQKIDTHPEIQRLRQAYPDRSGDLISPRRYRDVSEHLAQCDACEACPGLTGCQNVQKGHRSVEEPSPDKQDELVFRLKNANC